MLNQAIKGFTHLRTVFHMRTFLFSLCNKDITKRVVKLVD